LQHGPLNPLLPAPGHVHGRECEGVEAGVVHGRGNGHWRGSEVLHLLCVHSVVSQVFSQFDHLPYRAAGMAGHEIGQKVLLFSHCLAGCKEALPESVQHLAGWLMHAIRDRRRDVLRSDLEVAGDVMPAKLFQIGRTIGHYQIMPDPRADEDLFHTRDFPEAAQETYLPGVVFVQRGALCRAELIAACTLFPARTGKAVHIGCRPAHIGNDAIKALHLRQIRSLAQDGILASALHNPALVVGQSAKGAGAKAAPVAGDRKADRLQGRNRLAVRGMSLAGKRQLINAVQLLCGAGAGRVGSG